MESGSCYGTLKITARTVARAKPFGRCQASPYTFIGSEDDPDRLRVTLRLL
jgi:hypothetical protein